MLRYSLWVLAGAWSLQLATRLPPGALLPCAAAVAVLLLCSRRLRWAGCWLLGACVVWLAAGRVLDDRLPRAFEGDALAVVGRVVDFPDARANPLRLVLAVDDPHLPARIRLSWYDAPVVPGIGETWRLDVKLARPRGFANPLYFDYEHWLFRQRIGATGYVLQGPANARVSDAPVDALSALRARLAARLLDRLANDSAMAVLLAVTVGATHEITREEWDRYAVTGTSHLMAISGMNIAMAAGGAFLLAWALAAPFCRRASARDVAACVAAGTAVAYSVVSGFAIPVQRAMLMALLVLGAALLRRQVRASRLLAIACLAVVALDPLSVHAPGFKLSFAAVAILIWSARRRRLPAAPWRAGPARRMARAVCELAALQLELLLGLLPLTALSFGRVSWLAPLVNLLVVPLFELVSVPAALLGLLLDGPLAVFGDALLVLAWQSVRVMLCIVDAAAALPHAHADIALLPPALLPVAWLPALWAVLPPGFPGRRLAWVAAAALVLYRPPAPPPGCVDIAVLDVGQGLSVVARTSGHTLVYDTGPSFRSGGDTGALVVVPYLRAHGVTRIDRLVISHADSDHAGGVRSVVRELAVGALYAGEPLPVDTPQRPCRAGQRWTWSGVRFLMLHPAGGDWRGNDGSCVLEIAAGARRVLFTGDIEFVAERRLLEAGVLSAVELVLVPHHGSRTSSGAAFVARLRPGEAVVSAGYRNRWGMPKEDVVQRWERAGARVRNTATAGEIEYRVCPAGGAVLTHRHRVDARRYWHE
jgi:competence protein ComEC